jgi:hypothetical protein
MKSRQISATNMTRAPIARDQIYSLSAFLIIAAASVLVQVLVSRLTVKPALLIIYLLIFLAGLWFIRKTLHLFFTGVVPSIVLIISALGTNLFYFAFLEYQLEPVLVFSLYSVALFLTASWHQHQKTCLLLLLAIVTGLIVLVYPCGYIAILIPALWGVYNKETWNEKKERIRQNKTPLLLFAGCLIAVVLLPLLIFKVSPGEIKFLDFKLPGVFYMGSRYFWNDLFSFDHGWLIYTPILFVPALGFYFLADRSPAILYSLFIFCTTDIILEACWTQFDNSPVLGQVAFIQLYPILALPAGFLISRIVVKKRFLRMIILFITGIFIVLNLFQSWQYKTGIIFHQQMTTENYFKVFGRTRITEEEMQSFSGYKEDATAILSEESRFNIRTLASFDFEDVNVPYRNALETQFAKSGKFGFKMNSAVQYSPGIKIPYGSLIKRSWVGLRFSASVLSQKPFTDSSVILVVASVHEGNSYRIKQLKVANLHLAPGIWNTLTMDYISPSDPVPGDELQAFVWNLGNSELFIDDLKFELFEPKK